MPLVSSAALGLLLWDVAFRHFAFPAWLGGSLAGLSFPGLFVPAIRPFLLRRGFQTVMESVSNEGELVELELREGELISRIPGRSEARFQPAAIRNLMRDDRVCLIYIRKNLFVFVPRKNMPERLWDDLVTWAGQSGSC